MTDSATATDPSRAMSEIETDRGVIQGRIVRVTSAYVLIAQDHAIVTMPMNKVREIRWFFVDSPAADFLDGTPVPADQVPAPDTPGKPQS